MLPSRVASLLSINLVALGVGAACGQNYPFKPLRMLAAEAGTGADLTARLIAQGLSTSLGQQVIVENHSGSVMVSAQIAAKASPDGYTLLFYGAALWLLPFLQDNVPYDPVKDFAPVALAANSPNVLVVHPSVSANSVRELIELAKSRPGEINYGSGGPGSSSHLGAELFTSMAGINMVRVNYKGAVSAINGLAGGEVQMMITTASGAAPYVKSGRLKALAIASAQPTALAPGLPTVASGLPGYEFTATYGVFAPAKTPAAIINRLNREIVQTLDRPDVKEKLFNAGIDTVSGSASQLAATLKSDMAKLGKVIRDAAIRSN